jgi:TonB-dependent receptor
MGYFTNRYFLLFLFLFVGVSIIEAQKIKGTIIDSENGDEIIGATIYLKNNPSIGTISGLDGSFVLNGVAFPQTIIVGFVGYEYKEIAVEDENQIQISIKTDQYLLNEVLVLGETRGTTDNSARMLEKTAGNIINIVSARAIEISPDLTVANVIQRISGVTIERNNSGDGQYAILRGMDKRYNYTLVNSVKIPSPDNKNRYVPLDIFPSELLDRLEVTKALTADMEGDAIGGVVNLIMKDAPSSKQLTVNLATGYTSLFTERQAQTFNHRNIDRRSPFEKYGQGYPAKVQDFTTDNLVLHSEQARPNLFAGFSFGNRYFKQRLGIITAGSYQNSIRGSNSMFFNFSNSSNDASNLPILTKGSNRLYTIQQKRLGVHVKMDYRISKRHKLELYNAYMDFSTPQVRDVTAIDFSTGYDPQNGNFTQSLDTRLRLNQQTIYNSTLKGKHDFGKLSMDWSAVYSTATNSTPDNVHVYLGSRVNSFTPNPPSVVSSSGGSGGMKRRWERNSDNDLAGYLNFNYRIASKESSILLSSGLLYRDKQRTSFYNQYNLVPFDDSKPIGQRTNLIYGIDWNTFDQIKFNVENPQGSTGDPLNYDASEKIGAGYFQSKFEWQKTLIIAGVRIENTQQGYFLKNPTAGVTNDSLQQYTNVLPSVHFRYSIHKDGNLRASYYKSINRPSFFEIVPYRIIEEEFQERGNPNLNHSVANNFDIRYEFFPRLSEQIMIGFFYKELQNPIEIGIFTEGQNSFYMPANFGTAHNAGLEIDITKFFNWFGIKANYTYTNSSISTTKVKNIENPDPTAPDRIKQVPVEQTRPLNNQAANVANFSLLVKKDGWDGQIALAYTGERIYAISRFENNDVWIAGFIQLDASIEKAYNKNITFYAKASNLLDTPMIQYVRQQNPLNEDVHNYDPFRNGTQVRNDRYGQTIMLGFRYKFF